MNIDFEQYLINKWQEEVTCTENDCLDDDIPDVFNKWLCELEPDDFIKYANEYINGRLTNENTNKTYGYTLEVFRPRHY